MNAPFPTTRWSVVSGARAGDEETAKLALDELCKTYWHPIYAFLRSTGHEPDDAEDLTQSFFAQMLSRENFAKAQRERGRMRTFLHSCLKHHLTDEWRKLHSEKRGAGARQLSIDRERAEQRYANEPRNDLSPDKIFERQWATALLGHVMDKLRQSYEARGKGELFAALRSHIPWKSADVSTQETAVALGLDAAALRMQIYYLRNAYRDLLHEAVADTVDGHDTVEDELAHLRSVFADRAP